MNNVTAQGDYRPLVEDGKTWIYNWYGSSETKDGEPLGHFTYRLDGDTVIGLQVCKKLFYSSSWDGTTEMYEGAFYEKDRQVFYFRPDSTEAQLFYDFNLGIGDQFIYEWGNAAVRVETPVFINAMVPFSSHDGRQQVAYSLCPNQYREFTPYGEGWGLMIEGIGSYCGFLALITISGSVTLAECRLGDELLFDAFSKQALFNAVEQLWQQQDGIKAISPLAHHGGTKIVKSKSSNRQIFDLTGRCLSTPPARGLYIQDGKVKGGLNREK